jgi:hypothetical protein
MAEQKYNNDNKIAKGNTLKDSKKIINRYSSMRGSLLTQENEREKIL